MYDLATQRHASGTKLVGLHDVSQNLESVGHSWLAAVAICSYRPSGESHSPLHFMGEEERHH